MLLCICGRQGQILDVTVSIFNCTYQEAKELKVVLVPAQWGVSGTGPQTTASNGQIMTWYALPTYIGHQQIYVILIGYLQYTPK